MHVGSKVFDGVKRGFAEEGPWQNKYLQPIPNKCFTV